jgi:hypothetical protein
MSTRAHVLVVFLAAATIVLILQLVRQRQLRAKYSVLWLSIGVLLAVLALFPNLLVPLSNALGIDYPPATFMLLAVSFLLVLVLHFVESHDSKIELALAEEHALRGLVLSAARRRERGQRSRRAVTMSPSTGNGRPVRASSR